MFLTDAELFDLTGYRRGKDRKRWLDEHGFTEDEHVITLREPNACAGIRSLKCGGSVAARHAVKRVNVNGNVLQGQRQSTAPSTLPMSTTANTGRTANHESATNV